MAKKQLKIIALLSGVLAFVAMLIMLKIKGISEDLSIAGIFIILTVISLIILFVLLRKIKILEGS